MIDTNSMGIPMMYQIQRKRCFPLPSYDLTDPNRVKVTLFGKILDKNYTQLLYQNSDLDLQTVFLLDKVQKREVISKEAALRLRKQRLVEGRYPHLIVSYKVANIVGTETEYLKDKGLSNEKYKQIIINALERLGESRVSKLTEILEGALPAYLDNRQKAKKVSYILRLMRQRGLVEVQGAGHLARWKLIK